MDIVDTHCHIHEAVSSPLNDATHDKWDKAGKTDPDQIIADAHKAGVKQMICVGTDVDDSTLALEFSQIRQNIWASIGIHPHEATRYVNNSAALQQFASLTARRDKLVAIGECGLDYFYEHSPKSDQALILRFQIELALRNNLPMIFHVREAFGDFWPIFDSYRGIRGVIHSFSATQRELDAILERDLYVGLNGIVTFTIDSAQIAAFQSVPVNKMLIETDAPYLTPKPYRGTICESKHATTTLTFVANMQGVEEQYIAAQTTENARKLFNLSRQDLETI